MDVQKKICRQRTLFFSLKAQWDLATCTATNTHSLSLSMSETDTYFAEHDMIYSEGGGSTFVQMCASLNACPQKDKNRWPVLHSTHRHWHALHQAKESLFSIRLPISASKHSLSSSIFPHLICQRLKKQRQKSRGEKSLPAYRISLFCWKAEFQPSMFGIVSWWIKLPQSDWVGCHNFGWAAINKFPGIRSFNV